MDANFLGSMLQNTARKSAAKEEPGDYYQDGLLYCGKCHTPKQCRVDWSDFGMGVTVVGCLCACAKRRYEEEEKAQKAAERRIYIDSLRTNGIIDRSLRNYRFENAEETEELRKCRIYVEKWPDMRANNSGLLFWGDTGKGKTFCAACIANALIDKGVPAMITSFPRILNAGWDKSDIAEKMRYYHLLVIDDLGAERHSEYAKETVYMVIDERYKSGLPMIITTNLLLSEMEHATNVDDRRIYDRVLEMCVPVCFDGKSFRQRKKADKLRAAKEIFS